MGYKCSFSNVIDAFSNVINWEKEALLNAAKDYHAPVVMKPDFRDPIPKIIPIDNVDYPFVGFYNSLPINAFIPSRLVSSRFALKPNLNHRKYLFRGQSSFFEKCVPNIFRDEAKSYYIDDAIEGQEMKLLMLSHPLVKLLDLGVNLCGRNFQFEMNLYGLTQHYYNKTLFLDLTSDPMVAAFFAVTDYNPVTDEYIPVIDEQREGVIYYYDLEPDTAFKATIESPFPKLTTIGLQVFPRSGNQHGFLYSMEKGENFNEDSHVSYVKFKHNAEISRKIYNMFDGGKNLFPEDILTKHWKQYNLGKKRVSCATVRVNQKANSKYSYSDLKKQIEAKGYRVKDYKPSFTDEELSQYYQDIKNGFWADWCKDIYFPGDKDGKLKEALLQVENNDNYKWAFKPGISYEIPYSKGFLLNEYKYVLR